MRLAIHIEKQAKLTVCKEDIEIALLKQDASSNTLDIDQVDVDDFVVHSPSFVCISQLKADLEKLDGADSCEVSIDRIR